MTHPLKSYAEKIAGLLTNEELDEFAALLDGDANDVFASSLEELNMQRNPQSYGAPVKRKTKDETGQWMVEDRAAARLRPATLSEFRDSIKNGPPDGVRFHQIPLIYRQNGHIKIELLAEQAHALGVVVRTGAKEIAGLEEWTRMVGVSREGIGPERLLAELVLVGLERAGVML